MPISCVCDYTANRNLKTGILMYISIHPFSVADIVVRVESEFISFSAGIWYHNRAACSAHTRTSGRLAQLVEHLLDVQEVTGSSPVPST